MTISVYMAISLDGFIARPDGNVSWLDTYHEDPGNDYGFGEFFASVDALVMGRKTFEQVLTFPEWGYGAKPVIVLSNRGITIPASLSSTVECMAGTPNEIVERLSRRGLEHLYLDGGATVQPFLAAGLIDTLTLTRVPLLLGSGIPLFGTSNLEIDLQHLATEAFANGLVQSKYRVSKSPQD